MQQSARFETFWEGGRRWTKTDVLFSSLMFERWQKQGGLEGSRPICHQPVKAVVPLRLAFQKCERLNGV